jgi:hypothetical protein
LPETFTAEAVVESLGLGPVRWPDPITPIEELIAQLVMASPRAGRRIAASVRVLLAHNHGGLDQLISDLDFLAIQWGQHDDGEVCAALLLISDRLIEWRNNHA